MALMPPPVPPQVAPLFAMHGLPKTPQDGDTYVGSPGNEMTRNELAALFAVIGTPCWADVAAVQEPSWRRYLHHLPGTAPTLYRRWAPPAGLPCWRPAPATQPASQHMTANCSSPGVSATEQVCLHTRS